MTNGSHPAAQKMTKTPSSDVAALALRHSSEGDGEAWSIARARSPRPRSPSRRGDARCWTRECRHLERRRAVVASPHSSSPLAKAQRGEGQREETGETAEDSGTEQVRGTRWGFRRCEGHRSMLMNLLASYGGSSR